MKKKRLIYTLLYNKGYFMLSRNFRLQKVGDFKWLKKHYNFEKIAFSIDELIILDVTREGRDINEFSSVVKEVIKNVFIPVACGGGIRTLDDAKLLLNSGADKIVVNTTLHSDKDLINTLVKNYGSQFVVGSVDFLIENDIKKVYIDNGKLKIDKNLEDYLEEVEKLSIGEIYLNSIQKDGTGQGYDIKHLVDTLDKITTPIILAGGAGNHLHLIEGLKINSVDAVATANLFNFLGDALPKARIKIMEEQLQLANFESINDVFK